MPELNFILTRARQRTHMNTVYVSLLTICSVAVFQRMCISIVFPILRNTVNNCRIYTRLEYLALYAMNILPHAQLEMPGVHIHI